MVRRISPLEVVEYHSYAALQSVPGHGVTSFNSSGFPGRCQLVHPHHLLTYIMGRIGQVMALEEVALALGALVGVIVVIPVSLQFVANVSRNMALSNVASSEEQSKIAVKKN